MTRRETDQAEEKLILRSRLSEIAQLPVWVESLASRHEIPENAEFAINLCLEEAVSNIIRHGYGAGANGSVIVRFHGTEQDLFVFVIEDEAQHFNPLAAPAPDRSGTIRVGGRGIPFLRHFTDKLEYEPTPAGNRLRLFFSSASSEL
jgi:anti-sigma regulatory factor (Ser/Thr protein kinase)